MKIVDWIVTHWDELIVAVLAIVGALEVIAKWTETDKDDKVLSTIEKWIKWINGLVIQLISYITKLKGVDK